MDPVGSLARLAVGAAGFSQRVFPVGGIALPQPLSPPTAMAQLNPDYILADSIVGKSLLLPAAQDDPQLEADFWSYVGQHCSVDLALPHTEYGPLTLYHCRAG